MADFNNFVYLKEFGKNTKTPDQVSKIIAADFKLRGLTHAEAANKLNVTRQVVTNQLAGKRYFGPKASRKYQAAFGYNPDFLKKGVGSLLGEGDNALSVKIVGIDEMEKARQEVLQLQRRIKELTKTVVETKKKYQATLRQLKQRDAEYSRLMRILESVTSSEQDS